MTSGDYYKEKEILLSMEVKLRLLDLEGIQETVKLVTKPIYPDLSNFQI